MAKKSDFSQKLVDDLRLRKAKMANASSSSTPPAQAYGSSQWLHQAPGEATSNRLGSNSILTTWIGTRQSKPSTCERSSLDIIPLGGKPIEQSVDVSMALALALSNSGKLQNLGLVMHHGLLNFREIDSQCVLDRPRLPTNQLPSLPHMQIREVSKGVQNLNKVLKTCSSGLNFGGSLDIGRELLKGAMDLEESLRMLISLQEASDYMVGYRGKQVRMLKIKEEDESLSRKTNNRKPISSHRLSLDGSSKYMNDIVKECTQISTAEQSYQELSSSNNSITLKPTSNRNSINASKQIISHRRSVSCSMESKPGALASSILKNSASGELPYYSHRGSNYDSSNIELRESKGDPVCEKVRIPNVIAKLMGLEEIPIPKTEMNTNEVQFILKTTKKGKDVMQDAEVNKKKVHRIVNTERTPKRTDSHKKAQKEKGTLKPKSRNESELVLIQGMTNSNNINSKQNVIPASNCPMHKQVERSSIDYNRENRPAEEKVLEVINDMQTKERKRTGKSNRVVLKIEQVKESAESQSYDDRYGATSKHEFSHKNKSPLTGGARFAQDAFSIPAKQRGKVGDKIEKQQFADHSCKRKFTDDASKKVENRERNKLQCSIKDNDLELDTEERYQKSSTEKVPSASLASKDHPIKASNKEKPTRDISNRSCTNHNVGRITVAGMVEEKKFSKTDASTDKSTVEPPLPEVMTKKAAHIQSEERVNQAHTTACRKPGAREAKSKHIEEQTSFLHEPVQTWKERTDEDGESKVSLHAMDSRHHVEQVRASNTLLQSPFRGTASTTNGSDGNVTAAAHKPSETSILGGAEVQSFYLKETHQEGPTDHRKPCNFDFLRLQKKAIHSINEQRPLTENEYLLKQMVMNSQHLLNTAQALFRLEVPVGILQASEDILPDKASKLTLDCISELMRRKGKREEAIIAKKLSSASIKQKSLDALVQELSDDLESLNIPTKDRGDDYDTPEYLHKILERDILNRNPDISCLWDFGWNCNVFAQVEAEEVVQEVEKHIIDGLIIELARHLHFVSMPVL